MAEHNHGANMNDALDVEATYATMRGYRDGLCVASDDPRLRE
jgi:hypothetical protein